MATKKKEIPDEQALFREIEKRAFELYLERKRENRDGDEATDWLQAEREVRAKHAS